MRVCLIIDHPLSGAIGGSEVAMAILAEKLVEKGVSVHYVSLKPRIGKLPKGIIFHPSLGLCAKTVRWGVDQYRKLRAFSRKTGLSPQLPSGQSNNKPKMPRIGPWLSKVYAQTYESGLRDADADIYMQVCAGRPTGYVGDFCKKNHKPFIFRAASLWDADLTFTWGWTSWRDDTKQIYLQGVKDADMIVPNSMNTTKVFIRQLGPEKVRFVSDGFHIPPRMDLSRRDDGYVVWLGRDRSYKHPELYVELARMLPKHHFVIVGDIPPMSNQPSNLSLLGLRQPDEVAAIYSEAKVLVSTSEVEGFPNILIEAGMYGVPWVGFLDPDDAVARHRIGFQVKDLAEMAERVDMLMNDENLRFTLGSNARRLVEEHYDIEKVIEKWLLLFEEVAHGGRV